MKTAIELIQEERQRQIEEEGWTPEHDDEHSAFQLSSLAGCYIANAQNKYLYENSHTDRTVITRFEVYNENEEKWEEGFPNWEDKREKHDHMKSLVIAGALIVAEIERLKRLNEG